MDEQEMLLESEFWIWRGIQNEDQLQELPQCMACSFWLTHCGGGVDQCIDKDRVVGLLAKLSPPELTPGFSAL